MKSVVKFWLIAFAAFAFTACSGDDGVNGVNGKDAEEVNVDSLAKVIREDISRELWDSLYTKPYLDTVYSTLFDNTLAGQWMDSVRGALLDSLKGADYDSLYQKLYDSVYNDVYTQAVIRPLKAWVGSSKDDIYGAFANQYKLMYKDFTLMKEKYPIPVSVKVQNACERNTAKCQGKKVMLRAWVEGFTDTTSVSGTVEPGGVVTLAPTFSFDNAKLLEVTAPVQSLIQLRVYALENDREILFFSGAVPTNVHPMQINGAELVGVENRMWWHAVWVTPNMDSIPGILDEVTEKLPEKTLMVYQRYSEDKTIAASSVRVAAAVFDVLHKRGIRYIENDEAGSRGQKINYPIEVLRSKQAVCNEFSMLFASVLEAIGFNVVLVIVPSHMFVGWQVERGSDVYGFVETTLLANDKATFENAYESAVNTYNQQVDAGAFKTDSAVIIDLPKARDYGILPNDIP